MKLAILWSAKSATMEGVSVEQDIVFVFEDKKYKVSHDAYILGLAIRLPDGRMIRPNYWETGDPPVPKGLAVCGIDEHVLAELVEDGSQS